MMSHVEAVGRQQQPAIQPCTNSTVNFLGNPRGGICEAPVIHLMRSIKLTPSMPEVKIKITAQESMHTTSNSMCNKAGIDKLDLHICVFMGGWKTNQSPIPQPLIGEFPIISMRENQGIRQLFQLVADEHQKFMSAPRTWVCHEMMTLSFNNNFLTQMIFFKEPVKIPPASMDVSTSLKNLKVVISASLRIWDSLKFTVILS